MENCRNFIIMLVFFCLQQTTRRGAIVRKWRNGFDLKSLVLLEGPWYVFAVENLVARFGEHIPEFLNNMWCKYVSCPVGCWSRFNIKTDTLPIFGDVFLQERTKGCGPRRMTSWCYGINSLYETGHISLEEGPWWAFAIEQLSLFICDHFPRIALPAVPMTTKDGERTTWQEWYGTLGDLWHLYVDEPVWFWARSKFSETLVELPYNDIRAMFYDRDREFFDEEAGIVAVKEFFTDESIEELDRDEEEE